MIFETIPEIISIPDIDDPPNWVSHAESYHGEAGIFLSVTLIPWNYILNLTGQWSRYRWRIRDRLEGWRVRETARMMSTIDDSSAVSEVLSQPSRVCRQLHDREGLSEETSLSWRGGEPVSWIDFGPDNYLLQSNTNRYSCLLSSR